MTVLWILVKVTIITVVGLLAVRLTRRQAASVRHMVAGTTFLLVLLVPLITFFVPAICLVVPSGPTGPVPSPQQSLVPVSDSGPGPPATSPAGDMAPSSSAGSWRPLWFAIWLTGGAVSGWPVLLGAIRVRSLRRSSLAWPEDTSFRDARLAAQRRSPRRNIALLLHESVQGPITWGLLRPIVVLPAEARTWSSADIERALIHEFEHVRRYDWLTQCVARVVCAMLWFHPCIWVVWHTLTLEAERACDDAVIGRGEAAAYAEQLLRIAEHQAASGRHALLLAMIGRHDLARRIRAVLDQRQRRGRAGFVATTLIGLAATVVVVASTPIQLVPVTQHPTQVPGLRKEVRMPKRTLPLALTGALTAGLVAQPQPSRAQEPQFTVNYNVNYAAENGLTAETDEDFIRHAVRLCAIEIQAGKLAMTKTSNAEVKAFAEQLVNDHSAIANALAQWATKKTVVLKDDDPTLKMKLDKHKSLETKTGADFDRAFVAAIMTDQTDAIMLVNNERRNSQDAGLRAFAEQTRLTLIAHMNAARPLRAKLY